MGRNTGQKEGKKNTINEWVEKVMKSKVERKEKEKQIGWLHRLCATGSQQD